MPRRDDGSMMSARKVADDTVDNGADAHVLAGMIEALRWVACDEPSMNEIIMKLEELRGLAES